MPVDILSENVLDLIVTEEELGTIRQPPLAVQPIDAVYSVAYFDRRLLPPLTVGNYSYTSIPKCYHRMDDLAMEEAGIARVWNQSGLGLTGKGILIGIIDTGIEVSNPLFWTEDGRCRILRIWDQNGENPPGVLQLAEMPGPPEGFLYGREYGSNEIAAGLTDMEEGGHGTFLASLCAGGKDAANAFSGAAYESELLIVRLKRAKQYLRNFFFESEEDVYQENDLMAGVAYLSGAAERLGRPLVLLLGLGTTAGGHIGTDPLSVVLDRFGEKTGHVAVVPAGNQAAAGGHFYGRVRSLLAPVEAQIVVEEGVEGFVLEVWSYAPDLVRVVVQSPTGQQSGMDFPILEETRTTNFIFENTILTMDYRMPGRNRRDLLIYLRFLGPAEGIWTLRIYSEQTVTGGFHAWLGIGAGVRFLQPDPDTTVTSPGMGANVITVGAYNGTENANALTSGRGFDPLGRIKPDFCAPGVSILGAGVLRPFETRSGTSVASAIAAGAAAQTLEWGILQGNAPTMNSTEVKNFLIRGCIRQTEKSYPNVENGYGYLDLYHSFEILR